MDLNEIVVFVKVVQAGSFSKAARELGMPNSTVSSKVSALEKRLGLTLIQRTTRKLTVTEPGEAYFKRCIRGLDEIRGAETELVDSQAEPQGLLRITAPVELGSNVLPALLAKFTARFPKVSVELILSDRRVDLLGEGIDLAIRAGELQDSSLRARKLGSVYFAPFASSRYLKAHGAPESPKDLRDHQCIQFTPLGREKWVLRGPRSTVEAAMSGRMIVNDLNAVKALALEGNGIAMLPTFFCFHDVKAGRLERVLPEWRTSVNPVHFVYPAQKFIAPKLSAFMDLTLESLQKSLQEYL